jgi:signal transduction histidine kinase/CheY-like chemotaxis protein
LTLHEAGDFLIAFDEADLVTMPPSEGAQSRGGRSVLPWLVAASIAYSLGLWLLPARSLLTHTWVDLGWTAMMGWAAYECWRTRRVASGVARAYWWLGVANAVWFSAQWIWNVYEIGFRIYAPFPTLADAGYLLFAPLYALGLSLLTESPALRSLSIKRLADFGIIAASLLLCTLLIYGRPMLAASAPTLDLFVAVAYPAFFLAALGFGLLTILPLSPGPLRHVATIHVAAVAWHAAAFTIYGAASILGEYEVGRALDPVWFVGFACTVWACHEQRRVAAEMPVEHVISVSTIDALLPAGAGGLVAACLYFWRSDLPYVPSWALFTTGALFVGTVGLRGVALARLEAELRARVQERERDLVRAQQMQSVATLAGGLAHDFNNLLTGILTAASLLRTRLPPDDPDADLLELVEQSSTRAAELTRRLLVLGRGRTGRKEAVSLGRVLGRVEALLRSSVRSSVQLSVASSDDHFAWGDEAQLEQALLNLALNGAQAMPAGGTLELSLSRTKADGVDYVVARVRDEGGGIPEQLRERIFEPFFTTRPVAEGSGLGLAMVSIVSQEHGGFVRFDSKPGQGTTFELGLPAAPRVSQPVETSGAISGVMPHGSETILVVDDRDAPLLACKFTLVPLGYRVLTASHPSEALELAARQRDVALVITDSVMPVLSGRELIEKLREQGFTGPAILMTGYEQELDSSGKDFDAVLAKPFKSAELAQLVRRVLNQRRLPSAANL